MSVLALLYLLLGMYFLVLLWMGIGFVLLPKRPHTIKKEQTELSIIICGRNEEQYCDFCLRSILAQDYDFDKVQIIFVNDASTDKTLKIADGILSKSKCDYELITNSEPLGKKKSIIKAIGITKYDVIVLRDADTFTISKQWLKRISENYLNTPFDLLIGPVAIANHQSLLWAMQAIENNVLTVLSAGSVYFNQAFLCSGANLIFTKTIFEKVNGYASHQHIPSGDDVLFLQDVKKQANAVIGFLKEEDAIVYTYPIFSFTSLLKQKIRWAAKFKFNPSKLNLFLALLTFCTNAVWLLCFVSYFISYYQSLPVLFFVLLKLAIDILLLFLASRFIKNKWLLWYVLPVSFIYPIYAIMVSIGSLLYKPNWK